MKKKILFICFFMLAAILQVFSQEEGLFTSLEEARQNPELVVFLQLKKKKLKKFPNEIFSFPNLKHLDLSKNKIQVIPSRISELTQLETLNLSKNKIQELPQSIGELKNLTKIDLNRNDLTSLPASMGKLIQLKMLILWANNIDTLPDEMANLNETLAFLDMRSINMNPKKQQAIKELLPRPVKMLDQPCNCSF